MVEQNLYRGFNLGREGVAQESIKARELKVIRVNRAQILTVATSVAPVKLHLLAAANGKNQ